MITSIVGALWLALAVSGCAQQEPQTCQGTPCPTSTTASPPTSPALTPGPGPFPFNDTTLRQLRWENCTGAAGEFEVPRAQAATAVPSAFVLQGDTPQTASFLFHVFWCKRVANTTRVLSDHGFFHVLARVRLANDSWDPARTSLYRLDLLTSSSELGAFMAQMGVPNRAGTFSRKVTPLPAGGVLEQWKLEAQGLTVDVEYNAQGQRGTSSTWDPLYWSTVTDGYRKIEAKGAYTYDTVLQEPGVLRMTGSSASSAVLAGSCCIEWLGRPIFANTELWTENLTLYRK